MDRNQLETLPTEISQLTSLRRLDLTNNQLKELPTALFQLQRTITTLYLKGNQLEELPSEIFRLTALEELDLSNNQLKKLPAEVDQLTALMGLNLSGNQLEELDLSRYGGSPLLLVQRGAHFHARSNREFKLPRARADVADRSWLDRT